MLLLDSYPSGTSGLSNEDLLALAADAVNARRFQAEIFLMGQS